MTQRNAINIAFLLFAFLIFIPAFTIEFAMHNDYSMMIAKRTWLGFIESPHLLMIGRALGGVLVAVQSWFLNRVSDFVFSRFIGFGFGLVFIGLFSWYLHKRLRFNFFWAAMTVFAVFLLPVSHLYIIWAVHLFPGFFNVLLAFAAYLLLERARSSDRGRVFNFYGGAAFSLFVVSLFIYPPTSMFVFVMTFCLVLFSPLSQWKRTRRIAMRDLLFFGAGMIVYRLIDRWLVFPTALETGRFSVPIQPEYGMSMATDLLAKAALLKEIFVLSLSGTWHLLIGSWGIIVPLCFAIILVIKGRVPLRRDARVMAQMAGVCIVLFLAANIPCLLAKNYVSVLGYRVLFPAAVMIVTAQFWMMSRIEQLLSEKKKEMIKIAAVGLIFCAGAITLWNNMNLAFNLNRELKFIRSRVAQIDNKAIDRFVVVKIPKGRTLIGRDLPYEFSYMITDIQHVTPILAEAVQKTTNFRRRLTVYLIEADQKTKLQLKNTDYLIDLTEMM